MAKKYDADIVGWVTRGGKRIPIRKGDVKKSAFSGGSNDSKAKDSSGMRKIDEVKTAVRKDRESKRIEHWENRERKRIPIREGESYATAKDPIKKMGRDYKKTDTGDILDEIKKNGDNSAKPYLDRDGKLNPEREKTHKEVIDGFMDGKVKANGQGTVTFLGGGSASGKSSLPARKSAEKDFQSVIVDPDDVKKALPGFESMSNYTDESAMYFHEESSALAKRLYGVALNEGVNVVYDGTGNGSVKSMSAKIQKARDAGYKVKGEYSTVDIDEAIKRSDERYWGAIARGENPRYVPHDVIRSIHEHVSEVALGTAHLYDDFKLYDNNVPMGKPKVLIATAGNGKGLKAVKGQEEALRKFLKKSDVEFFALPDGTIVPLENAK